MNPDGLWKQVQSRAKLVAEFAQGVAFDLKVEADEALRTGLGFPRAATDVASFACFAVAAAGTASMTGDFIGKVWGTKECERCNGWEGLACCMCKGNGKVQFAVKNANLKPGEKETVGNVATAVAEGRAEVLHLPTGVNYGPLPTKDCPTCTGAGVMKCPLCEGNAWKPKISFDKMFDAPWRAWDVYRKSRKIGVDEIAMGDPNLAKYWMFVRPELESGVKIPEEAKKRMWWDYERTQEYNKVREFVESRAPGWEEAQKTLVELNPNRALTDSVVVHNIPYFNAVKETEDQVMKLSVPPRPAGWGKQEEGIKGMDEFEKLDPKSKEALEDVIKTKERVSKIVLDNVWAQEWREQKMEEMLKTKAQKVQEKSYVSDSGAELKRQNLAEETKAKDVEKGKGKSAGKGKGPPVEGKNKLSEEEKKKREREERKARLAKQAAEREAALSGGK